MQIEEQQLNNTLRIIKQLSKIEGGQELIKQMADKINWHEKSERYIKFDRYEKYSDDFTLAYQELDEKTLISLISKNMFTSDYDRLEPPSIFLLAKLKKFDFLKESIKAFSQICESKQDMQDHYLRDYQEILLELLSVNFGRNGYSRKYDNFLNIDSLDEINSWFENMVEVFEMVEIKKNDDQSIGGNADKKNYKILGMDSFYEKTNKHSKKILLNAWYLSLYLNDPENYQKNINKKYHKNLTIDSCVSFLSEDLINSRKEHTFIDGFVSYIKNDMCLDKFKILFKPESQLNEFNKNVLNSLNYSVMAVSNNLIYTHTSYSDKDYFYLKIKSQYEGLLNKIEKLKYLYTIDVFKPEIENLFNDDFQTAISALKKHNPIPLYMINEVCPLFVSKGGSLTVANVISNYNLLFDCVPRDKGFVSPYNVEEIKKQLKSKESSNYSNYSLSESFVVSRKQYIRAGIKKESMPDVESFTKNLQKTKENQLTSDAQNSLDKLDKIVQLLGVELTPELDDKIRLALMLENPEITSGRVMKI